MYFGSLNSVYEKVSFLIFGVALLSCNERIAQETELGSAGSVAQIAPSDQVKNKKENIKEVLDQWHLAAKKADFEQYFRLMSEQSVFIGTDASENWKLEDFKEYSKPHFDKGKAWNFTPLDRNIFISHSGSTAWFHELLDTHMGICRGSGVLSLVDGEWKIEHYVLSLTIPNEKVEEVKTLNEEMDSIFISELQ